jgi:hypothetical protein
MKLKKIAALAAATSALVMAGAGAAMADASSADGSASHSPGIGSGNNTEVPVNAPINVTGNGIDVIGVLDWVFGNHSDN